MMTLAELRSHVRTHLDATNEDIPDSLLDVWAQTAFTKITTSRRRFGFLETAATVTLVPSTATYTLPVGRVTNAFYNGRSLERVPVEEMLLQRGPTYGDVSRYAVYGTEIRFWPTPTAAGTVTLLGQRKPVTTWLTSGPIDLPDEYQPAVTAWVLCEAYKQQQDIPMANNFAVDFETALQTANNKHIDTPDSWVHGTRTPGDQW